MSVLVLGGRGKTSSRIATLLAEANVPFMIGSRSKSDSYPHQQVHFDWFDQTDWDSIFTNADPPIKAAYLVAPPVMDPVAPMRAFIEKAGEHGVKRFVQLSAANIEAGGPAYGQIHQYLIESGVEHAVLRPTWFMENFSKQQHLPTIKNEGKIYTAAGEGKVPFVSVEDIAAVGFHGLVDEVPHNSDHIILGPELLSYDDVAEILSDVLDRKITHDRLSVAQLRERFVANGMPVDYATMLSAMDGSVAKGSEGRLNGEVIKVTGREPRAFQAFAEKNRDIWT